MATTWQQFFQNFFKMSLKPGTCFSGSASLLALFFSCETENRPTAAILVLSILTLTLLLTKRSLLWTTIRQVNS